MKLGHSLRRRAWRLAAVLFLGCAALLAAAVWQLPALPWVPAGWSTTAAALSTLIALAWSAVGAVCLLLSFGGPGGRGAPVRALHPRAGIGHLPLR